VRILFLSFRDPKNPYVGGGDIYINELAKGCARRGHSVTIISSKFPGSKNEEFVEGLHVIRMGNRFTMFMKVFRYYNKYLRGKFDVVVEEIIGGPRLPFLAFFYTKGKMVGILQQRHKEIFRHQFTFPIASFLSFLERFLALLYREKIIVVNSSRTKRDLCEIGFFAERLYIINPGLPRWFFTIANTDFELRGPCVVCIAKARRWKLIDQAIRAMKSVCKVMSECKMVIVGRTSDVDTKYEDWLPHLVEELGLSKNVFFRNDITEPEKIELLRTSRVLVLPSASEGFGIVVIEANACGTPAIVSNRVPRDAAIDGYNAIVFPYYDVISLSNAILSLISDEEKWTKISANAIQWSKKFTWNRSVEEFLKVIKNA